MASLFKRPTSKIWFACYRSREGGQIRKSTKLLDKAAAIKIAVGLERVENLAKTGMAAVSQFQRVVSQVSKEVIGANRHKRSRNISPPGSRRSNDGLERSVQRQISLR